MNRKYNLKLDLQFRCNNSIMKFNQFDNNTSDFFIKISNGGKSFDVEKAIVVLAVIKPSGKVASQFIEVKNGLVYVDLKPNMKDEIGTYTAQAMLILEDERVVTDSISYEVEEDKIFSLLNDTVEDTEDFTLLTDMLNRLSTIEISEEQRVINEAERILSEENRKIEESKRVEAELIRQHEEADRTKYDAIRESNENIRKQNESIRLANETNRVNEEAKRVEEEANRVEAEQLRKDNYNFMTEDEERRRVEANAHKEAENLRVQAETNRVNEEAKRRTTEQARVSAENTRVSNENTREANEVTRQTNETQRVEAETQRQSRYNSFIVDAEANANNFENYTNNAKVKEEERKSNELDRKSQEDRRVSNETERISNENTRKANEVAREKNETSRQNIFENKVDEVDKKIVELDTTKDNFVSSINTKVNNKISEIDNAKDNFVSNINTKVDTKISEIEVAKSDMTNTVSNKVSEVENRFNALTSKQQQDAEVIDARDGETSLKARLDRDIEKAKQVYVNVEGSHISTDSSVGYAKNIEILGNTVQSASNLADIRSVGDKVEGQELYEIPVLSCGKNLLNIEDATTTNDGVTFSYSNGVVTLSGTSTKDYITSPLISIANILQDGKCYRLSSIGTDAKVISTIRYMDGTNAQWADKVLWKSSYNKPFVYIQVQNSGTNCNGYKIQLQLEEVPNLDTQITPYEPYQEDKLTILSPVQIELGDRIYRDDIEQTWCVEKYRYKLSHEYLHTPISGNNNDTMSTYMVRFKFADIGFNSSTFKSAKDNISNVVPTLRTGVWSTDVEGVCVSDTNYLDVRINKNKLSDLTPNGALQYLQDNKFYVLLHLVTPQKINLPHDQQIKLRTFANKTNISFGCEIEGTLKAQVPKSLGATVNTHTEQISNLNKELDRVKKLEESTVSTVTTESDFTTVEQTTNGYFEDVKLEGKTLVNLAKQPTNNGSINHQYATISTVTNIKPSTEYTYIIRNNGSETLKLYLNTNGGFDWFDLDVEANSTVIGKAKTLPTIDGDIWLSLKKAETVEQNLQVVLLEGDYTQNPPSFFEGLKSVGEDVEEVSVKSVDGDGNLFDGEFERGSINLNTGICYENNYRIRSKNFNRIIGDCYVTITGELTANPSNAILYYDSSKNYIDRIYLSNLQNIKLPQNAHYFKLAIFEDNGIIVPLDIKISVYKGTTPKTYTPHQSDKKRLLYYNTETQAWEKPILRQWDSIEKHADGKYYYHQRSGEEDYTRGDESVSNYITDMTTTVKPLAQEKVYECTNIDLITYANETNFIVESGAITPKTTLKVHNNISNVVSLLQKKVSLLESNVTSYMITQNRLMLASRYNADNVTFKVDYPSMMSEREVEIDYDLFKLIQDNIIVGPENYDVDKMLEIMDLYAMIGFITWEMWDYLYEVIDSQINPVIGDLEGAPEI